MNAYLDAGQDDMRLDTARARHLTDIGAGVKHLAAAAAQAIRHAGLTLVQHHLGGWVGGGDDDGGDVDGGRRVIHKECATKQHN